MLSTPERNLRPKIQRFRPWKFRTELKYPDQTNINNLANQNIFQEVKKIHSFAIELPFPLRISFMSNHFQDLNTIQVPSLIPMQKNVSFGVWAHANKIRTLLSMTLLDSWKAIASVRRHHGVACFSHDAVDQ